MLGWQSKGVRVSSPSCFILRLGNSCRPYLLEREAPKRIATEESQQSIANITTSDRQLGEE